MISKVKVINILYLRFMVSSVNDLPTSENFAALPMTFHQKLPFDQRILREYKKQKQVLTFDFHKR